MDFCNTCFLQNTSIYQFKSASSMKHVRLRQSLKDQQIVNIEGLTSQLDSVSILQTQQDQKRRPTLKTASFHLPQAHFSRPKDKKMDFQEINEHPDQQSIMNTLITQVDETPSLIHPKFLRSSRLKHSGHKRRKKWRELKDVVTSQKVNIIKQAFVQKLKRNNIYSKPIQLNLQGQKRIGLLDRKGFELKEIHQKIISFVIMINIIFSIFIYSLSMVFQNFQNKPLIQVIQVISFLIFLVQMAINLITVRVSLGRKLQTFREISEGYKKQGFYLDFANIIMVFANLTIQYSLLHNLRLITLFKFPDCMQKLQKLQVYFIENYYYEQYWSLIKVLLFNFCFAHILSIILLKMANIDQTDNWMVTRQIHNAQWYQQYIWAYYWGTTVMLTIGFGDIVPVTYKQACCMILIQTISCVILSYNISCVGSLISNIRSQDLQRGKNLKIFKKLADKNKINQELTWKINNYIEQHVNIKKLFNIQEEVQFVQKLPLAYRVDYLKQANKTVFHNLIFFSNIMQKTLFSLAEIIQTKITHPQEFILNMQHSLDLLILKNGEVGFLSRKKNRMYSNIIIDRISIKQNQNPFLLHTNFITKASSPFRIKSIVYSVIYSLNYQSLINALRQSNLDFQMYCQLRDKNKHILDEFQVFPCENCKTKHTKFICPKLHFMPMKKHVIDRYLAAQKVDINERTDIIERSRGNKHSCLLNYLQHSQIYQKRLNQQKEGCSLKNIKKERYIIDQLKPLENDTASMNTIKIHQKQIEAISKMQIKFLESTTQIMKNYASKMFGVEKGEDQIWTIDADRMKNYRHYFTNDNSCNLEQKFDIKNRCKTLYHNAAQQAEMHLYEQAQRQIMDQQNSYCEPFSHKTSLEVNFELSLKKKLRLQQVQKMNRNNNDC